MGTRFEPRNAQLRDGRVVHLRAIAPSDEEELLQAFDRLGAEARYRRFMRVVREPDRRRLRGVLAGFPQRGFALAATVPAAEGIDIVGSATFIIGPAPDTCEFAISVVDDWAGAGLAPPERSNGQARRTGVRPMPVVVQNHPWLQPAGVLTGCGPCGP